MHDTLRIRTNGPSADRRPLVVGLLSLVLTQAACALNDVPSGSLLWLQGFDGNPPTPGFRVEGTVLLRSVDDIAHIGINLSSGAITNAPGGEIRTEVGVSGSRFINGSVINEGLVRLDARTTFGAPNARFENFGRFEVPTGSRAQFTGKGGVFSQLDGVLDVGDTGFELFDGRFEFGGGEIIGQPLLVRSAVRGPDHGETFSPRIVGPAGRYEGPLAAGVHLRVLGAGGLGGDTTVTLEGTGELNGQLEVGSYTGGGVALVAPAGGLWVRPGGTFSVGVTGGGATQLTGNLLNDGDLRLTGDLTVRNAGTVATNRADLHVTAGRSLAFDGGFRHEDGTLSLIGATLTTALGCTLAAPVGELAGEIRGALTNASELTLSQALGGVRVAGTCSAGSGSRLRLVLSEPESPDALLRVTGAFAAGGECTVEFEPGFSPASGAVFPLLQMAELSGQFRTIQLPSLPDGLYWNLERQSGAWDLRIEDEPAPGTLALADSGPEPMIRLAGTPGQSATLWQSTDLANWYPVQTNAPFNGDLDYPLNGDDSGPSQQFFRATISAW